MGHAAAAIGMTAEQFLEWDRTQTIRHEFVAAEVFAMAGGEDRDAVVAGNLCMALRAHLRGRLAACSPPTCS